MQLGYDDLTPEQKNVYESHLTRVGLSLKDVDLTPIVTANGGYVIGGASPSSGGTSRRLIANHIADLKRLSGIPDEQFATGAHSDRGIDYPPELEADRASLHDTCANLCELGEKLSHDEHVNIAKAAQQFVLGNSEKVKSYEPVINAMRFPTALNVTAAGPITIKPGSPLVITGTEPQIVNFTSVTVEPGGQIIIEAPTTLNAQVFTAPS